jgi:hypothetical protein
VVLDDGDEEAVYGLDNIRRIGPRSVSSFISYPRP